jgi:hypothetical protein
MYKTGEMRSKRLGFGFSVKKEVCGVGYVQFDST